MKTTLITTNTDVVANAPIGLFDSGVGGLSVFRHLQQVLPHEGYLYYADTLNVPYGNRDNNEISALTLNAVDWLIEQKCKLVVIACNSASAHGLELARKKYPNTPIVGLVPALKPAVQFSKTKKVAVLATGATLNGDLLNNVIDDVASPNQVTVVKWFEPNLVPWVEAGMPQTSDTAKLLKKQLHQFYNQGVDQLVLGCTHYPFFRDFLMAEVNKHHMDMDVIDSGRAIANRVKDLLLKQNLLIELKQTDETTCQQMWQKKAQLHVGSLSFYASLYDDNLKQVVTRLLSQT